MMQLQLTALLHAVGAISDAATSDSGGPVSSESDENWRAYAQNTLNEDEWTDAHVYPGQEPDEERIYMMWTEDAPRQGADDNRRWKDDNRRWKKGWTPKYQWRDHEATPWAPSDNYDDIHSLQLHRLHNRNLGFTLTRTGQNILGRCIPEISQS